jgi:HTH-type transcriptional regulator/antitoxin HigA
MPFAKTNQKHQPALAGRFEQLVQLMPPQAIRNDAQYQRTLNMIDRLMARRRLTQGQRLYLETLVQLVQAYEAENYSIDTSDLRGIDSLRHLLTENGWNASDLARLLGVHVSMGSKILKGERSLTVDHLRKLAARFHVRPELFID